VLLGTLRESAFNMAMNKHCDWVENFASKALLSFKTTMPTSSLRRKTLEWREDG
jgi:hypothetical protein